MKDVDKLKVTYEYEIGNRKYTGNTSAFYTLVYPETQHFFDQYDKNRLVTVFFNPKNPAESVLIPGVKPGNTGYSEVILATTGIIISLAIVIAGSLGIIG